MARPSTNLNRMVREVLRHTSPLPPEAECPIRHFERSTNAGLTLLKYIDDHIEQSSVYGAVYEGHIGHLRRMVLAEILESFERFLKELASACVDFLAPFAADDRFDRFLPKRGEQIAAFVHAQSIGKALCESDTWLSNASINERFKSLLKEPFGSDWELLFPGPNQHPIAERDRAATLAILWQIRHNLAHNVGVITHSDSMRFRVLIGGVVNSNCRLTPSSDDLKYAKRFLLETAKCVNDRVAARLGRILEVFHRADPTLFDAQNEANRVSGRLSVAVAIDGTVGSV